MDSADESMDSLNGRLIEPGASHKVYSGAESVKAPPASAAVARVEIERTASESKPGTVLSVHDVTYSVEVVESESKFHIGKNVLTDVR